MEWEQKEKDRLQSELQKVRLDLEKEKREKLEILKTQDSASAAKLYKSDHEELRDFIKSLKSEKDKLVGDIEGLNDKRLQLETKLADALLMAETLKNQLDKERA